MKLSHLSTITILCALCFAKPAKSQNWALGLHFGENLSTIRGYAQADYLAGFMGGVHVSHYLTENIVLRLEANIERKGTKLENTNPNPDPGAPNFGDDYRFDYLSLPVMLRYSTSTRVKFIAGGGASIDYLVHQRTDYGEISTNDIEQYRIFDTDLVGAIGGSVPFGDKLTFSLEFRGMWGLVDVDKPKGTAIEFGKNLTWGLMAGINYYL